MTSSIRMPALLALLLLLVTVPAHPARWMVFDGETHDLFLPSSLADCAPRISRSLDSGFTTTVETLGTDGARIPVIVEDLGCLTFGMADPVFGVVTLSTFSPGYPGLVDGCADWWRLVGTHEYAHIEHLRSVGGLVETLYRLVGFPATPNVFTPYLLHEGVAVYAESSGPGFEGRLNAGPFTSWIDILHEAGDLPDIAEAVYTPSGFPGKNGPYLLGAGFVSYLALTYGQDRVQAFIASVGSSHNVLGSPVVPGLTLDPIAESVFGRTLPELWAAWTASLADSSDDASSVTYITHDGGVTGAPARLGDQLVFGRNRRVVTGALRGWSHYELVAYDFGSSAETVLARHTAPIRGAVRCTQQAVYYMTDHLASGFDNRFYRGYGVVRNLWRFEPDTGRNARVLRGPIRTFDVTSGGTIYYVADSSASFGSWIWRVDPNGEPQLAAEFDWLALDVAVVESRLVLLAKEYDALPRLLVLDLGTGALTSLLEPFASAGWLQRDGEQVTAVVRRDDQYGLVQFDPREDHGQLAMPTPYTQGGIIDPNRGELFCATPSASGIDIGLLAMTSEDLTLSPSPVSYASTSDTAIAKPPTLPTLRTNLSYAWPSIRLPFLDPSTGDVGFLFAGRDALGGFEYVAMPTWRLREDRLRLPTAFRILPAPWLRIQAALGTPEQPGALVAMDAPVFRSLDAGLQRVDLGLAAQFAVAPNDTAWIPWASFGFRLPNLLLQSDLALRIGASRHSELDTGPAILASLHGRAPAAGGETSIELRLWPRTTNPAAFGLLDIPAGLAARENPEFRLCVAHWRPLLEIHRGLWSPSLYLAGLSTRVFAETRFTDRKPGLNLGVDLLADVGVLFRVYLAVGLSAYLDETLQPHLRFVLRDVRDVTDTY